jgi:glycosyltransferase involved in cell wall biosynthesis
VETFDLMSYRRFVRSLDTVAVGLHPVCIRNAFSQGKSFGKLLAYLAADVAVVTSNEVDHPLFFEDGRNGMLVPEDAESWVDRCERLLRDAEKRRRIVAEARSDYLRRLTTTRCATLVDRQLEKVLAAKL